MQCQQCCGPMTMLVLSLIAIASVTAILVWRK
jgi:hypothetical protein